jgi:hypothetical protein
VVRAGGDSSLPPLREQLVERAFAGIRCTARPYGGTRAAW